MQKQIIDQSAHFVVALVILLLPLLGVLGATLAGLTIGLVREQGQHGWNVLNWGKFVWLDVSAWVVGGFVAGIILAAAT